MAGIILSVGLAAMAGGRVALAWHGLPGGVAAGPVPVRWIAPVLFALVFLLPALEAAAGVALLGRLFARFDVSAESWT